MSFRVVSEHSVAKALQTLENCVLYMMKTFGSQSVANTLHGMSEQRYTSSETLLLTLEGRVEEISGEFNPRDVTHCGSHKCDSQWDNGEEGSNQKLLENWSKTSKKLEFCTWHHFLGVTITFGWEVVWCSILDSFFKYYFIFQMVNDRGKGVTLKLTVNEVWWT